MAKKEHSMLSGVQSLDNEKRLRILSIVDKLRELGVSENVSLPQLVVVGDQSSGKSSLLEGLTGLSFPIDSDLCTRFATQMVLRRVPGNEAKVKVTIIPGPTAQADEVLKEQLQSFARVLETDSFGPAEFAKIFDEAAQQMGLPGPNDKELENLEKRFSDDILKIELSGPDQLHLSVVDVPGLFHNPTKYQTKEDRDIIRGLIQNYITDKRTIILAVLDAKNNLANQEVFSMARAADPQGARTVGIITKCDTLEQGDEEGVLRIARNETEKLRHGWFAVKNRSTKDIRDRITIEQRHIHEETFFASKAPWTELSKDRVGINKLRQFLGNLLYDHIRGEFPSMVKEIEELTRHTKSELKLLGPSRQFPTDQRRVLMHIASKYQAEVTKALNGNYAEGLQSDSVLKLRLRFRQLNEEFADDMALKGHARAFQTVKNEVDEKYPEYRAVNDSIYDWIRDLYRNSRGVELPGTVNPVVLEGMFREQSAPWREIARSYLLRAVKTVRKFNDQVFDSIIGEDGLRRLLRSRLKSREESAFGRALD
ncbi:dynamin family protein [Aspergillus affinis]|uniref:dynamin family protein n=1 Tax=Aspergillus affinis TaxID=1070780 RepID=UPI0022FEB0EA|nr:P-loop containing nucleoside triphosphate hydrolase protein [Aspergillus affinis]KAI9045152.1 P-loop containing nucleoside triphosphate hydrolase protein [Aspergillus affinis]